MPSIYQIKPAFQKILRPTVTTMVKYGITANQVTLMALGLSVGTGLFLMYSTSSPKALLVLPIILFVRMALNAIDGMIAKEHNQKTHFGALLNELGDVLSDTAIYLPLALQLYFSPWLIAGIVFIAILSEFIGVVAVQIGADRAYQGPMGKSDRAFAFGAMGLAIGLGVPPGPWINLLLCVVLILGLLTCYNRVRASLRSAQ